MKKNCLIFLATLIFSVCFSSCKDLIDELTKEIDMTFVNHTEKTVIITSIDCDTSPNAPIYIPAKTSRSITFNRHDRETETLYAYDGSIYSIGFYTCDDLTYCVFLDSEGKLTAIRDYGVAFHPTKVSN